MALRMNKSKSLGPDDIPYAFIQNLPLNCTKYLLVIRILKPNKNKHLSESYRPIILLSTLCKLLEIIINRRLIWFPRKMKIYFPRRK